MRGVWLLGISVVLVAVVVWVVMKIGPSINPTPRPIRPVPAGDITAPVIDLSVTTTDGTRVNKGDVLSSPAELNVDVQVTDENPVQFTVELDGENVDISRAVELQEGSHAFLIEAWDDDNRTILVFDFQVRGEEQARRVVASFSHELVGDHYEVVVTVVGEPDADPETWELFPVIEGRPYEGLTPTARTRTDSGWSLRFSVPKEAVGRSPDMYLVRGLANDVLLSSGRVKPN